MAEAASLARGRRRVFHPIGLVLDGVLELDPVCPPALVDGPLARAGSSIPVVARLSKGISTPGALPDVLGIALRLDGDADGGDLLFATCGSAVGLRHVFLPASDWLTAFYGSVLPFDTGTGRVVLGLQPVSDRRLPASAAALRQAVSGRPLHAVLLVATLTGPWQRVGRLRLDGPGHQDWEIPLAFHPVDNAPAGLRPAWDQKAYRLPAYHGSQQTRRAPGVEEHGTG